MLQSNAPTNALASNLGMRFQNLEFHDLPLSVSSELCEYIYIWLMAIV
jgi:hypothetical protein